jgi:uncharacterized protein (DUF885 family)
MVTVRRAVFALSLLLLASRAFAQTGAAPPAPSTAESPPDWIARSNADAQILMQSVASFIPEMAGMFGVEGMDDRIMDLRPKVSERSMASLEAARAKLERRLLEEKDPRVRQDLEILVHRANLFMEENRLQEKLFVPYFNMSQMVFQGTRTLLDDQIAPERRAVVTTRLRRYAGLEAGYEPITKLAMDRTRERLKVKGLLGPAREEVERDLENQARFVGGIEKLMQKYEIKGYEEPYAKLKTDLAAYENFIRNEILPRSRTDFRQPPEMYAMSLRSSGVDMPVQELVSRAQAAFQEIVGEMQALAPLVARDKGFKVTDYRDVIRELKKDQIVGEAILPHYEARIKDMEELIRKHRIVTLPDRAMRIRLASEAESAAIPAPNMRPPRMIGNTGEMGEFVLPLRIPGKGGEEIAFDDFTTAAASWTLTAHEGRPGHELQFASMVEGGVSQARALFSLNSVNVEGWALYAEAEMKPYEPLDGQLMALQHRLLRAARAFLDPGLQLGTLTQEEAMRVLREDVCLSEAMATQEVQRYSFLAPGQAPSYFCGYSRLQEIRTQAELALGKDFDRMKFHDFLLAQGTMSPTLLRKAVQEEFIPGQRAAVTQRPGGGR